MNPQAHIELYEIERAIERACKQWAESHGLVVNVPADHDSQRPRPRVEFAVSLGEATDHRSTHDGVLRCDAWSATLEADVITSGKPDDGKGESVGYVEHSRYRALVRYLMDRLEADLTSDRASGNTLLPLHVVNRCVLSASTTALNADDGALLTKMTYSLHVQILPAAWPDDTTN